MNYIKSGESTKECKIRWWEKSSDPSTYYGVRNPNTWKEMSAEGNAAWYFNEIKDKWNAVKKCPGYVVFTQEDNPGIPKVWGVKARANPNKTFCSYLYILIKLESGCDTCEDKVLFISQTLCISAVTTDYVTEYVPNKHSSVLSVNGQVVGDLPPNF